MLDVDANVVSADELVRRVRDVLARTERGELPFARTVRPQPGADPPLVDRERAAAMHERLAEIQQPPILAPPGTVGKAKRFGKKAVRKLVWWYVEPRWVPQREFDTETAMFASDVESALARLRDIVADTRSYTRRAADRTRILVHDTNELTTTVAGLHDTVQEIRTSVTAIEERLDQLGDLYTRRTEFEELHGEVSGVLARLGASSAAGADVDYVAFEERFRGESEGVKESQSDYVHYYPPPSEPGAIVDIGCGRGEMLELLLDAGHEAVGVDSDAGMVAVCREKGLTVDEDNGLTWLAAREDSTLKGIFCSQVVEHLFTSELMALVRNAHAKLRPGGVIIMETINPRSWHALGNHFLADTSHVRPVHPETLRFICEQVGFSRADLLERGRHQLADAADDLPEGPTRDALSALLNSVYGFQDYAIIATK
jgi:2-polyprenyl-3-methyl-5-hydroxy-6-metoxy-1,4-benzoquinol methylase